ncbi:MAG: glycosyl hydrolase, partial [Chloroflexi bacterium]|nr:glycosyl hydrolase [Chloroflexota bacterium]
PVLYAGTEPAAVFRSDDYGESWHERPALRSVPNTDKWMFPSPPHKAHVKTLTIHPTDPRTILAGVEQGALLESRDAGESWHELDAFSTPEDRSYKDIHQVHFRPSNSDELYLTTGPGLYHSTDRGQTWEQLTRSVDGFRLGYPDHLIFAPHDDRVLFMSGAEEDPGTWRESHRANATILRSTDGGKDWILASGGLPSHMRANIEAMSIVTTAKRFYLFAGTTDGTVFYSDDGAENWQQVISGLPPISKSRHYVNLQAAPA